MSITASIPVTVTTQGALFPNLPAGLAAISDTTFDAAGKLPPTSGFDPTTRWQRTSTPGRISIGSLTSANIAGISGPFGNTVLIGSCPLNFNTNAQGQPTGISPFKMAMQFTDTATPYRYVYQCVWIRTSDDWTNPTGGFGTKMGFWQQANGNPIVMNHWWTVNNDANPVQQIHRVKIATQFAGTGAPVGVEHTDSADNLIDTGNLKVVEIFMDAGTPGSANGVMRIWVDGVSRMNKTLLVTATGDTAGFRGVTWEPTFGAAFNPKQQYIVIARWAAYAGN